jgi:hypothetical protein
MSDLIEHSIDAVHGLDVHPPVPEQPLNLSRMRGRLGRCGVSVERSAVARPSAVNEDMTPPADTGGVAIRTAMIVEMMCCVSHGEAVTPGGRARQFT